MQVVHDVAGHTSAPEGAVVLAAFFFGSTFILVKDALEDISPLGYLVVRFSVGALALALLRTGCPNSG